MCRNDDSSLNRILHFSLLDTSSLHALFGNEQFALPKSFCPTCRASSSGGRRCHRQVNANVHRHASALLFPLPIAC